MSENLMVGSHKSSNAKFRSGYDRIFGGSDAINEEGYKGKESDGEDVWEEEGQAGITCVDK
jgi:hypothetical protein